MTDVPGFYEEDYHTFCANGDGTYDGVKAFQWLYNVATRGKRISYEDAKKDVAEAIAKRKAAKK